MRDGVRFAGGQQGISTDTLIDALAGDLSATPVRSVRRTLALAFACGSAVSAAAMLALLGLRPDMASALATASFWIKLIFPFGLAVAGLMAVDRLGRPGAAAGRGYVVGIAVAGTMALLASIQLATAPRDAMRPLLLGHTLDHCTALIMLLALPILAAGMYAMRQMAPTRLRLAGAAVGVTAGALSAAIYAIACDETALPFVTLWYGAGIALTGVLGALLGPRLLRW
ncbi:DUF1109 domain-containing protein [Xanthobacter autotrophicus]|uniref:DUF1109 domain-containing protein n=1 Tax=Xanthobacter autotrophicus TaxID=280 RepID=UPI0024A66A7D|nr:DUF1109 domain-containing protein [Xanthobacter autotrophicus]MDI4655683.1 DUF1109 domain-containing protein [Xanthobacter autotrophicus]